MLLRMDARVSMVTRETASVVALFSPIADALLLALGRIHRQLPVSAFALFGFVASDFREAKMQRQIVTNGVLRTRPRPKWNGKTVESIVLQSATAKCTHIPVFVASKVGKVLLYPSANVFQRHSSLVHHGHRNNLCIIEWRLLQWIHFVHTLTFGIINLASERVQITEWVRKTERITNECGGEGRLFYIRNMKNARVKCAVLFHLNRIESVDSPCSMASLKPSIDWQPDSKHLLFYLNRKLFESLLR